MSPQGHNIFCNLSSTEYSDLMQLLKQSILATDLTLYFEYARFGSTLFIKLPNVLRGWLSQQCDHLSTLKHSGASLG